MNTEFDDMVRLAYSGVIPKDRIEKMIALKLLSAEEIKVFDMLEKLNHDSIWGVAISMVTKQRSAYGFRRLISQLKSEGSGMPETMKKILGAAYDPVMNL